MNQPLSYVHPQARVAKNVVIEPFSNIEKNVEIDEGSWIGSNVTIMEGARIGKNVKIFPGAVISAIPQDLKFDGEETTVTIGDNTTIREFVTVNRGTKANMETRIGKNCLLMAYAHVAHDCIIGNHVILANCATLAGHIEIGDWAIIGGLVAVHQFVHIGPHVMISGGSLVRKDVPPFTKAAREPLSYVGVNSIGLRRRGYSNEQINHIQDIYRILYVNGLNVSKAVSIIEAEIPASQERDEILFFITNSSRGIMKGYSSNRDEKL
ncbi:MAG: acyl-ACP--UDP-N-acetylglucosamine O-acyltransferase [Bacteroidia bacterium]|nr:acyl-ACP--UDP-N-acetylglucosamine O-acyltransferase [Bacteroidales bacterium]NCD42540.1 acyl-ACP--UDP-N-acetylglucosamine O-acyltransferase [Bacteroidia bacterium]MDD2323466.1 acyl-ACP--UDP-N-acetylglucosamine O-acyltransferase [Bacteroidales bacterium]MDD3010621.1 acyl-ACP--UDP-N-acetylglucosamine O-acyltransferase [Bacteroidales bacterium]MDD3962737.1 acyl-ACP--UDP-N-acetylglucosamine O-acyltransferase [Bacteroidales bacterium]